VEHPITELCTGVDLVRWQVLVADGQALPLAQDQIQARGAAIECRVYAEDPVHFLPSPGQLTALREPTGPGVRVDSGVYPGAEITSFYDPMVAKLAVWAADRPAAIARMARALDEYRVAGIQHNLAFHRRVMAHPGFRSGIYDTGFIDAHAAELTPAAQAPSSLAVAAAAIDAHRRATTSGTPGLADDASGWSTWRRSVRWRR
jgi:acetyl-CoA carboxylase biotin carboxylase subunit